MSGATIIDGDIHQQARARIAVAVGILMGRKNVARNICKCEAIAAAITARLDMSQLFTIVHGTANKVTSDSIDALANYWLDRDAAVDMIDTFMRVGGIGPLAAPIFDGVLERMLAEIKRCNPFSDEFLTWPDPAAIEERAVKEMGSGGPADLTKLETAMRALLSPPAPRSPETATRWQAWRAVSDTVATLMKRKNVAPGAISSEGIAALLVEGMSAKQHTLLASGRPDEESCVQISSVAENEIDYCAATMAIRIFTRAGQIGEMSDLELIDMASRVICHRRGNASGSAEPLVWPSPIVVEELAACCIQTKCPHDLGSLEAAILPLFDQGSEP